jgi:DNA invertase Pin-like site-specific DNA recombinase
VAVDQPHANEVTIHILAAVAQHERKMISARTKAALAAAKTRGVRLGNPRAAEASQKGAAARKVAAARRRSAVRARVLPHVAILRAEGRSTYAALADGLNAAGMPTPRGTGDWHAMTVYRVMRKEKGRLEGPAA